MLMQDKVRVEAMGVASSYTFIDKRYKTGLSQVNTKAYPNEGGQAQTGEKHTSQSYFYYAAQSSMLLISANLRI